MWFMSLLDRIRKLGQLPTLLATGAAPLSPWASDHLNTIEGPEFPTGPISREQAMTIPAVVRARTLIVTTVARTPLVIDGTDLAPGWLHGLAPIGGHPQTAFHRLLHTADDLLFHGASAWAIERDQNNEATAAIHIPRSLWARNADGTITVDSVTAPPGEVAIFDGIHAGILTHGATALRDATKILHAASRVADTPAALIELRQTNDAVMNEDDIKRLISGYVAARRGKNGGVSYSSNGVEVHEHSIAPENLLIEGRNASSVDVARLVGVPAPFIDASVGGTSLSYENAASRMTELITFGVAPLLSAIVARLNLPDLTPLGEVRFDTAQIVENILELTTTPPPYEEIAP